MFSYSLFIEDEAKEEEEMKILNMKGKPMDMRMDLGSSHL